MYFYCMKNKNKKFKNKSILWKRKLKPLHVPAERTHTCTWSLTTPISLLNLATFQLREFRLNRSTNVTKLEIYPLKETKKYNKKDPFP